MKQVKQVIVATATEVLRSVLGSSVPFQVDAQEAVCSTMGRVGTETRIIVYVEDLHRGLLIGRDGATARALSTVIRAALTMREICDPVNVLVSGSAPRG